MTTQEAAQELLLHVREAFISASPGPDDVEDAAAQAVYGFLFPALEGAEDDRELVRQAVTGALEGAIRSGAPVWHASRGALIGVLHAAVGRGAAPGPWIDAAVGAALGATHAVDADYGAAAEGALEGCVLAADELGLSPSELATRAARAALDWACAVGPPAHDKLAHLVTRHVMGIPVRLSHHTC